MQKFFLGFRKVIVASLLIVMASAVIVPTVHAGNKYTTEGKRTHSTRGYRSFTKVTGVDDRGISLYMTAAAGMQGLRWTDYGTGVASVYSDYFALKTDAYHAYGVGKGVIDDSTTWIEN